MEYLSKTPEDTKKLAGSIAEKLKPGDILSLKGDLGAGKTTFTRYLSEALSIPARIQSPTFVVARKYTGGKNTIKTINHIDLYRLTNREEVEEIGLKEIIDEENSITVIEWPELIEDLLPEKTIVIKFEHLEGDLRKFYVQNLD